MRVPKLLLAVVAVVMIGGAGYGVANAAGGQGSNSNGNAAPAGASPAAGVPGTTGGMPPTAQVLYAVVNSDATLARAFKATGSIKVGTGGYEVDFAHDVNACAYEATVGNAGTGNPAHASIVVAARAGNTKGVFVETKDSAGNLADNPFHLVVAC